LTKPAQLLDLDGPDILLAITKAAFEKIHHDLFSVFALPYKELKALSRHGPASLIVI
jgi:hypothetical protein